MKKIEIRKIIGKPSNSMWMALGLAVIGIVIVGVIYLTFMIQTFFRTYEVKSRRPIEVKIQSPIYLEKISYNAINPIEYGVNGVSVKTYPDFCKGEVERLICNPKYTWDWNVAVAVAKAESNLDPEAVAVSGNGSCSMGIFQINSVHGYKPSELVDAEKNIAIAYEVYQKDGWTAWDAFNTGAYIKYVVE